jgi:hypothetical protein
MEQNQYFVGTEVIRNKGDNETENRKTTEKNH